MGEALPMADVFPYIFINYLASLDYNNSNVRLLKFLFLELINCNSKFTFFFSVNIFFVSACIEGSSVSKKDTLEIKLLVGYVKQPL